MKEFLFYIHTQLTRLLLFYKSSENLSKEDNELLQSIIGTITLLQTYAEQTKDRDLYKITDDLEYSVYHLRVTFKAESALDDSKASINVYGG